MNRRFAIALATLASGIALGAPGAQPLTPEPEPEPAPQARAGPVVPGGLSMIVGGGVFGFADDEMLDFVDVGGMWEVRLALGTRSWFAVEAAYVGSAADLDAPGLDGDAVLIGTSFEGTARVNVLELAGAATDPGFELFGAGGAGFRRHDVLWDDFNRSNVRDEDTGWYAPLSGGIAYRARDKLFEIRGTYRFSFQDDLVRTAGVGQDSWSVNASVGIEY